MPRVLNKRHDTIPADAIYVGRPSKWGNPYKVPSERLRDAAVELFRDYLTKDNLSLLAQIKELRGKDLVCWCAPKRCHADVLLELANKDE